MKITEAKPKQTSSRLKELTAELQQLEAKLRLGGGPDKIEKQHKQGKLTARERIELLLDKNSYSQEIGLLVAYDQYQDSKQQTANSRTRLVRRRRRESLRLLAVSKAGKSLLLPTMRRLKPVPGGRRRSRKFYARRKLRCAAACRSFI